MISARCICNRVQPGPKASLCLSEVVTLGILGQRARFRSKRDFYRYADQHLPAAFPDLSHRSQFNRLLSKQRDALVEFFLYLGGSDLHPAFRAHVLWYH